MAKQTPFNNVDKLRASSSDVLAEAVRDGTGITELTPGSSALYPIGQSMMNVGLGNGGTASDWPGDAGIINNQKTSADFMSQTFQETGIGADALKQRIWDDSPVGFEDDFSSGTISSYLWLPNESGSGGSDFTQAINALNTNNAYRMKCSQSSPDNSFAFSNFGFQGSFRLTFQIRRDGCSSGTYGDDESTRAWSAPNGFTGPFEAHFGVTTKASYDALGASWSSPLRRMGFTTSGWLSDAGFGYEPYGRIWGSINGGTTTIHPESLRFQHCHYIAIERDSAGNRIRVGRATTYNSDPESGNWNYGTGWATISGAESSEEWMFYTGINNRFTSGDPGWWQWDNFQVESGTVNAFAGTTSVWSPWITVADQAAQLADAATASEAYTNAQLGAHNDSTTVHGFDLNTFADAADLTNHIDATSTHGYDLATFITATDATTIVEAVGGGGGGLTRTQTIYLDTTAGRTDFPTDATFSSINDVDVLLNGIALIPTSEFTDTGGGTSITLGQATVNGDDLVVTVWKVT